MKKSHMSDCLWVKQEVIFSWTWFEYRFISHFYFIVKLYYIQKAIIRVIKMLCDLIQKLLVLICPVIAITKSCHVTHVHGNRPGNCPCNHLLRAIMHSSEYIGSLVTLFKVRRSSVALT